MYHTFFAQISTAIFQFFLVFFILRNEGLEALGFYGLFVSILNPIQQFFKFGIPKLINTSENIATQRRYLIISLHALILFLLVGSISIFFIKGNEYLELFLSLLFFKSLINFRETQHSIYTRNKMFKFFFQSSFYCNLLLVLLFWIVHYSTKSLSISFIVSTLIVLIFIFFDGIKIRKITCLGLREVFNIYLFKKHYLVLMKMSFANFIFNLKSNLPRYILATNFSINLVGIYTAIFQAISVLEIVNQSLLKFNYARLTEFYYNNIDKFKKIEKRIYFYTTIITAVSLIVNYFIGELLLEVFFGLEFKNYLTILLILIIDRYFAMINSIPKTIFILKNKIQYNILSTSIVLIISFLCLIKIEDFLLFNIVLVILSGFQFLTNKFILNKI